jgi:hypothetical protein
MQSVFPAVAGRLGAFLGRDAQVLQLESEIADACEQSVEVCLVSDLADELGPTGMAQWPHPLKSFREAIAEPAAHDDPGLDGSQRASPSFALRAWAECALGLGDAASPSSHFTQAIVSAAGSELGSLQRTSASAR